MCLTPKCPPEGGRYKNVRILSSHIGSEARPSIASQNSSRHAKNPRISSTEGSEKNHARCRELYFKRERFMTISSVVGELPVAGSPGGMAERSPPRERWENAPTTKSKPWQGRHMWRIHTQSAHRHKLITVEFHWDIR